MNDATPPPPDFTTRIVRPRALCAADAAPLPVVHLSVVDRLHPSCAINVAFVYRKEHAVDVSLLERSLEALISTPTYAPFAGTLDSTTPPSSVVCDARGVRFRVVTFDTGTCDEVMQMRVTSAEWDRLLDGWHPDAMNYTTASFVTYVHVARLGGDGGLLVVLSIDHRVTDIFGLVLFANAWAKLSQHMASLPADHALTVDDAAAILAHVAPGTTHDRSALTLTADEVQQRRSATALTAATAAAPTDTHGFWLVPLTALPKQMPELPPCRTLSVPLGGAQLERLRARALAALASIDSAAASSATPPTLTRYDVASAWLWALIQHVRPPADGKFISWSFVVNARFREPQRYAAGMIGNAGLFAEAFAPADTLQVNNPSGALVSDHALAVLAQQVHAGVQRYTPARLRSVVGFMDDQLKFRLGTHALLPVRSGAMFFLSVAHEGEKHCLSMRSLALAHAVAILAVRRH